MVTQRRTPFTILGCLTMRPMSGYDIKQFLEQTISHFWSESYGQIYPALQELEESGLVKSREEPGERGRERRVYTITPAGRNVLKEWLEEPAAPDTPRYEHSLKLFFGRNVGPEVSLQHIERLRAQTREGLENYKETEMRLLREMRGDPDSEAPYWLIVLRGGIHYSEMVLEWCDESEALLRSLTQTDQQGGAG
jgi:PadR family transcriptional regulator AphA